MNKVNCFLKLIISFNILFLFILNNNYSTSNDDLDSYRIALPCAGCHSVKKDSSIPSLCGLEEEYILSDVNDFDVCGSYIWNSKGNKAILLDTISLQEWEYVQADGIPGKKIYSISCDKEWVWFSTNKGVAFYNWKRYHNENE